MLVTQRRGSVIAAKVCLTDPPAARIHRRMGHSRATSYRTWVACGEWMTSVGWSPGSSTLSNRRSPRPSMTGTMSSRSSSMAPAASACRTVEAPPEMTPRVSCTCQGADPPARPDTPTLLSAPRRDGYEAKSGAADRAESLRPLGSSHSSCRPRTVRSRK